MYRALTYRAPAGVASAVIGPRYALDAKIGRRFLERFAVEAAYSFQDGDYEIASGGRKTAFDAHTHAIHGDVSAYLRRSSQALRPYLVVGTGAKFYQGIEQPHPRPLNEFGGFRQGVDARALLTFGAGVEWTFGPHLALRLDARDYATPFPASAIVPATGSNLGGWIHDFVPILGMELR